MCGRGFRLDHGPLFIGARAGTEGHHLHGAGEPFSPANWYHQQNGVIACRGVTGAWQLSDVDEGAGGFAVVPGSLKTREPTPAGVKSVEDDMGLVVQPVMTAGDVLFFAETATHGTLPWRSETERRSVQTSSEGLFTLPKPHCEPFRRLLAHPAVVSRLNIMCGRGFRFDHGPHYIGGVRGTAGLTMHGTGEPHRGYVAYHQQNGNSYCAGVTVSWSLSDAGPGDGGFGGFACVVGSHKSRFTMLFFMDGAQTHGTLPWNADHARRSVLYKYAGRTATRTGRSARLAPPEIYWGEELVEGMTPQERAVMYGPTSAPGTRDVNLIVDDSGHVTVGEENA